jgi:CheY-like chemotaxis protein
MAPRDTILVVDNTADVADLLREVLVKAGYRVLVAPTLEVGLTILAAFVVRLVLVDAPTPYHDDLDAGDFWAGLDRLAATARRIPLVVYAGANPERYAAYADHGYAAHLASPSTATRWWRRSPDSCPPRVRTQPRPTAPPPPRRADATRSSRSSRSNGFVMCPRTPRRANSSSWTPAVMNRIGTLAVSGLARRRS